MNKYTRWLEEVGLGDIAQVGGKNANLGEMIRHLAKKGINIPGGFVVTAEAYSKLIEHGGLEEKLRALLQNVDKTNLESLSHLGHEVRLLIKTAGLPQEVVEEIRSCYRQLEARHGNNCDVAVRSSASAEDLPEASFAGQQESFLNVRGENDLMDACLDCFASLFTDRAISYRIDKGFDHLAVRLSIGVQKMVRSDLAAAGVMFTLDPESGFRNVVLVTSAYGLGDNVVAGRVDPDEFLVFKPTLLTSKLPIVKKKVGAKQVRMIYAEHGARTKNITVPEEEREQLSLNDDEVLLLSRWACEIETYYSTLHGCDTPMDIEWAKDGNDGCLYIVQARPETVHSCENLKILTRYEMRTSGKVILSGDAIGEKIGAGSARIVLNPHELASFREGEVLIADMTDPDWEPLMKKASGIVTNRGGRTCHAAIVSRELGVPCVVGTGTATSAIASGAPVTLDCSQGTTGIVYDGILKYEKLELPLEQIPATRTKILINVGNPEQAFELSMLPVDGVGLAREEFIIANDVKIHPLALTRFNQVTDENDRSTILKMVRNYSRMTDYFVEKLSQGIALIASAFYPRPVIVRLSDFKTNEYANLIGGSYFEPKEENPMLGFRGASRYYDERYRDGFALECLALKKVRSDMGLTNVKVMVPFCRTLDEAVAVLQEMSLNGLVQGEDDLEVYVMCELPSNVWSIDEFARLFDGFSIGSNDLTQLILGLDRDSEIVARLFNERNPAVKAAITYAIAGAHKAGRKIGICGQAPSDYPELVQFLINQGIDSISLNEDSVLKTKLLVAEYETAVLKTSAKL